MDFQFIIGLLAGSILTFGYVARTIRRLYHPLIREHQAAIRDYEHAKENLLRDAD
jgi:hypothetical protein